MDVRSHHQKGSHHLIHGAVDPVIWTSQRGIWAVKWSFLGLFITALIQIVIVVMSGSVGLLADTVHNIGDAATAIPLLLAFVLVRWKPTRRFTYGYGRLEDLAGVIIVLAIVFSGVVTAVVSFDRFVHPQTVKYLWAVTAAAVVGFLGNEAVARFRVKIGNEIGSAALIAEGYHAHVDGLTSLSVLFGAAGVWLGYPVADPLVGLLIAVVIFRIAWQSGKSVVTRLLDGVDPEVIDEIRHAAEQTGGVLEVTDVRVRWLGHRLYAEVNLAVSPDLSVEQGHEIAQEARHQLLHHVRCLSQATIHIDPETVSGEHHHGVGAHVHGNLPTHWH